MKLVLQQIPKVRGDVRRPFLAPDAALSLASIEVDTDGLIYTEMWRDGVDSLLAKRMKGSSLVGYSPHNFGLAIDIDVEKILDQKKIRYEDLLWLMKRRGWYCFRRDGVQDQAGAGHFNFLGEGADKYLAKSNQDPITWQTVAEFRIWERHGTEFQLETKEVQIRLSKLGLFTEPFTGQRDLYTREAIIAFQRAWDLAQTGSPDMTLCRALSFVTADIKFCEP
jgi:hypothetical protein